MSINFLKEWKDDIFGKNNNKDIIVNERGGLDHLFVFKNISELPNPKSDLYYQGCRCYVENGDSFYEMRNNKWCKIENCTSSSPFTIEEENKVLYKHELPDASINNGVIFYVKSELKYYMGRDNEWVEIYFNEGGFQYV